MNREIKRFTPKVRPKRVTLLKKATKNSYIHKMIRVFNQLSSLFAAIDKYLAIIVDPIEGHEYGPKLMALKEGLRRRWHSDVNWPQNFFCNFNDKSELIEEINLRLIKVREKALVVRSNLSQEDRNICNEIIQFIENISEDPSYNFLNDFSDKSGTPSPQPSDYGYSGH